MMMMSSAPNQLPQTPHKQFHSAISDLASSDDAVAQVIAEARGATDGKTDVAFVFLTGDHSDQADAIVEKLWLELDPQCVVGCSAEGVIGGEREIERSPGISLLVGLLPQVRFHPFHISGQSDWRELLEDEETMQARLGLGPETRALVGFGDPFTTPLNPFLAAIDSASPLAPLIGGMASSAHAPGENVLIRNDRTYSDGFVGLSLAGPVEVDTIVSQGCRPIGRPLVITRSHDNVIEQLGGRPAMQSLREIVEAMPDAERRQLQNGLFVGRAISEYREEFKRGDFLIRNLVGVDEESGAVAMADLVKTGQTVQFHVRDAATADEDLELLLKAQPGQTPPAGGLLFSCNGRGTRMFEKPCHDIHAARAAMPRTPVAGFFAAGELGPVGGRNFIHGHTASFALFR